MYRFMGFWCANDFFKINNKNSYLIIIALLHFRAIRKYLRLHILPPLKETEKRPEETNTLRGHLCKFLTSPITQLRDLAAELLFILCKCNVSRMIKYTGFGNAAGLLAQKGLLGSTIMLTELFLYCLLLERYLSK